MTVQVQPGEARGRGKAALRQPAAQGVEVERRRFPYPYQAMLAVCSDLDLTPNRKVYRESMRFLNTTQTTSMGPGAGLEVGNTIYFDMPPGQFSYWNTDDAGREMIRNLIHSGHIDCLHSFGDLATTRAHATRALDELARHDCRIEVWVDHSQAPSNFGADIMVGSGDDPDSPVYHADLTLDYGITYVWRGRTTSIIGQNVPRKLHGLFDPRHPVASGKTAAKQALKGVLARFGHLKYAMHGPNAIARIDHLRDGQPVREFLRCNPHWAGVGQGATAAGFAEVLTERFLDCLVRCQGTCILYTHLGKIENPDVPFAPPTAKAFRRLGALSSNGKILVTTTRRLLGLDRARRETAVVARQDSQGLWIDVSTTGHRQPQSGAASGEPSKVHQDAPCPVPLCDLAGLTFYTPDPRRTRVFIDGEAVENLVLNGPDATGRRSVSLRWTRLEFPSP